MLLNDTWVIISNISIHILNIKVIVIYLTDISTFVSDIVLLFVIHPFEWHFGHIPENNIHLVYPRWTGETYIWEESITEQGFTEKVAQKGAINRKKCVILIILHFFSFFCASDPVFVWDESGQNRQVDGRGYRARHFAPERVLKVTVTWNKTAMEMSF